MSARRRDTGGCPYRLQGRAGVILERDADELHELERVGCGGKTGSEGVVEGHVHLAVAFMDGFDEMDFLRRPGKARCRR